MNQLVFIQNGRAVTDSLTVADVFGKDHDDVLRDIRNQVEKLLAADEVTFSLRNFEESTYRNVRGRSYPKFDLTEEAFAIIAMSYTTPEAMKMKVKFLEEFKRMRQQLQSGINFEQLSPELRFMIQVEQKQKQLEERVDNITNGMIAIPDHTKVVQTVNEYARFTRLGHNEVYNKIYDIMKARHGIDVKQRVENERERLNREYFERTGKHYSESTLKKKINGIDVMVRMGVLDRFNEILTGLMDVVKRKAN